MKKRLTIFLALFCLLGLQLKAQFAGGAGTQDNPYRITNAAEMGNVRHHSNKYFRLMNDISLQNYWTPINADKIWLDGNGFTIYISGWSVMGSGGLFSELSESVIQHLSINETGGGVFGGILAMRTYDCHIWNCHVSGESRQSDLCEDRCTGGFIGMAYGTFISDCSAKTTVNGPIDYYWTLTPPILGGFIGLAENCTIENSYADGSLYLETPPIYGDYSLGGFVASAFNSTFWCCYTSVSGGSNEEFTGQNSGNNNYTSCWFASNRPYNSNYHLNGVHQLNPNSPHPYPWHEYFGWDWGNWVDATPYPYLEGEKMLGPIFKPTAYEYDYDAAGNRIKRRVIYITISPLYPPRGFPSGLPSGGFPSPPPMPPSSFLSSKKNKALQDTVSKGYESPYVEKKSMMEVKVYPNPTHGMLKINIDSREDITSSELELYNIKGTKILSKSGFGKEIEMDITNNPAGAYVMRVRINNEVSEWKIIKQ